MRIKRTLSLLLVLAALLTMVPVTVSAQSAAPRQVFTQEDAVTMGTDKSEVSVAGAAIRLNRTKLTLVRGKTYQLKLNVNKKCKWTTSSRYVATVSSKGLVKAVNYGYCTVACTLSNGTKLKCKIEVVPRVDFLLTGWNNGRISYRIANHFGNKTLKKVIYKIEECDKNDKPLTSYRITVKTTVKPNSQSTVQTLKFRNSTRVKGFSVILVKAYFSDGSTWSS